LLMKNFREADDGIERRAQFMTTVPAQLHFTSLAPTPLQNRALSAALPAFNPVVSESDAQPNDKHDPDGVGCAWRTAGACR
jgi:hypothetical protein